MVDPTYKLAFASVMIEPCSYSDAVLKYAGPRTVSMGERIILTEHQPKRYEDGEYSNLMKSSSGGDASLAQLIPLHNYYSEFRLGHGDPLLKAAMSQWPCTTTDFSDPEIHPNRKRKSR
jgi:hypothetical protein